MSGGDTPGAAGAEPLVTRSWFEDGVRVLCLEGAADDRNLVAALLALWAEDDYAYDRDELYDLSAVRADALSLDGIRALAALDPPEFRTLPLRRAAILTPPGLYYGLARMYQGLTGAFADYVGVFRDRDEALAWLRGGV